MRKVIGAVILIVAFFAGILLFFVLKSGPKESDFAHIKAPRITRMPSMKVIQVTAKGTPGETAEKAFGLLYSAYFKLKDAPRGGPKMPAPRARWNEGLKDPPKEWIGHYALPVPESVTDLPAIENETGLAIELTTWHYGDIAEILHVGAYADEKSTFDRLTAYIKEQGYEIAGLHEEEYQKGPHPFLPRKPEDYLTILRYQVKKVDEDVTEGDSIAEKLQEWRNAAEHRDKETL